jgi:ATP-dependent Lon protease
MDIVCNANPLATRKILCLIGPPGVGKTFIAMCIARILFFEPDKNPSEDEVKNLVYVLSIPSLTGENTLLGSNAVYVGAQPGILTKEVLFVGSLFRKLIVIDEIDKPCKYVEQLLSVLDYTQNSKIVDNYFEIEVDMRTCVLIATANDESKINPIIRDRMQIIKVSGYSTYVKAAMVQKQMLRSLLKERGLQEDLIRIPLPVLEDLIMTRTREAGVRKLKNLILEIINTVNIAIITNISTLSTEYNKYTHNTYIDDNLAMQHIDDDYYRYNNYNIEELYSNITKRYISYLNRERDIRQFAYPVFNKIYIQMSENKNNSNKC